MSLRLTPAAPHPAGEPVRPRAPWKAPAVEPLGRLDMITLQQSVPIGPGGMVSDAERIHLA